MLKVPEEFQISMPFRYPPDNNTEFERWFKDNYTQEPTTRVYLPIMWTAYYVRHSIDKSYRDLFYRFDHGNAFNKLQRFIDSLPTHYRYFTIVQHDDGILHDLSHLDIEVYGMGGGKFDVALPLLCEPHKPVKPIPLEKRAFFASFVGQLTHPIRKEIMKKYNESPYMYVSDKKVDVNAYNSILHHSQFVICPRGYGPTSFRIQEAILAGATPVYISDEFIEPYGIPFEDYGIKIRISDIVKGLDIIEYLKLAPKPRLKEVQLYRFESEERFWDESLIDMFTYEGCKRFIEYNIS